MEQIYDIMLRLIQRYFKINYYLDIAYVRFLDIILCLSIYMVMIYFK